ncbi:hypothetical protein [Streptomyces parvulus]|uniref:hypothetical protein n=1 Tax=Streptomyces parvulus TaxID=146923 RepID=UPI0038190372
MMTLEEASQMTYDAIAAAVAQDADRAAHLVATLGADSDPPRMLGVCYAFAEAGRTALLKAFGDQAPKAENGEYYVLQVLDLTDGRPADAARDDRVMFSMRFLTAYCNGDRRDAQTHWEALLQRGPEAFVAGVCQLLVDVAGLCRSAIAQIEAQK